MNREMLQRRIINSLLFSYMEKEGHNSCAVCSKPMTPADFTWTYIEREGPQKEWVFALGNIELKHQRCAKIKK